MVRVPYIQQLSELDGSSPRFLDQLTALLDEEAYRDLNLSVSDTAWLVQYLDDVRAHIILHMSLAF